MAPLSTLFVALLAAAPTVLGAPATAVEPVEKRATHYISFFTGNDCDRSAYMMTIKPGQVITVATDWRSVYPVIKKPCRLMYCEDYECKKGWVKDPYNMAPSGSCSSTLFGKVPGQAVKLDCK